MWLYINICLTTYKVQSYLNAKVKKVKVHRLCSSRMFKPLIRGQVLSKEVPTTQHPRPFASYSSQHDLI